MAESHFEKRKVHPAVPPPLYGSRVLDRVQLCLTRRGGGQQQQKKLRKGQQHEHSE